MNTCLLAGVQATEDLHRFGGAGNLVRTGLVHRDPPGRGQPERFHDVEEL